jgi:hypothetical protein
MQHSYLSPSFYAAANFSSTPIGELCFVWPKELNFFHLLNFSTYQSAQNHCRTCLLPNHRRQKLYFRPHVSYNNDLWNKFFEKRRLIWFRKNKNKDTNKIIQLESIVIKIWKLKQYLQFKEIVILSKTNIREPTTLKTSL